MSEIRYIISDLDGTLADTFEANFLAYRKVLAAHGVQLEREVYRSGFGLNIRDFFHRAGWTFSEAELQTIKAEKKMVYPEFFSALLPNQPLIAFYRAFRRQGGHLALASTASRANLENVLHFMKLDDLFECIIAGEEVRHGKPDPECYELARQRWGIPAAEVLVFEDSEVGIQAAQAAGMSVIRIGTEFYGR